MNRLCRLLVFAMLMAAPAWAQDWGAVANISTTMGVSPNRLCYGEASRGDIGCPADAPTVTGSTISGTFVGDGSGLTGVTAASADRIVSGTAKVIANGNSNSISITEAGVTTGYFYGGKLVAGGVSTTGAGNFNTVSVTGNASVNGVLSARGGYGAYVSSNDLNIGGGSTLSPNRASIAWGDGTGWKLNFGTYLSQVFTPVITFVDNGRIGIGTATPTTALDISGTMRLVQPGFGVNTGLTMQYQSVSPSWTRYAYLYGGSSTVVPGNSTFSLDAPSADLILKAGYRWYAQALGSTWGTPYSFTLTNPMSAASGATTFMTRSATWAPTGNSTFVGDDQYYMVYQSPTETGVYIGSRINVYESPTLPESQGNALFAVQRNSTNRLVVTPFGRVSVGPNASVFPSTTLDIAGSLRLAADTSVTTNTCDTNRSGAIRYNGTTFQVCYGSGGWANLADASSTVATADRITSGTAQVIANGSSNSISITEAGVTTGYYYGGVWVAGGVSTTGPVSATSGYFTNLVGIGTSAATYNLDVSGSLNASGNIRSPIFYDSGNTNYYLNPYSGGGTSLLVDGKVGIGTTAPSASLHILGTTNVSSSGLAIGQPGNYTSIYPVGTLSTQYNVQTTGGVHQFGGGGVTWATISSGGVSITGTVSGTNGYYSGNVGVGATQPAEPLHIAGPLQTVDTSATNLLLFERPYNGGTSFGRVGSIALGSSGATSNDAGRMELRLNPAGSALGANPTKVAADGALSTVMTLIGTGKVGIGTTAPTTTLEVSGTVSATNFVGKFTGDGSGLTGISSASDRLVSGTSSAILSANGTLSLNGTLDIVTGTEVVAIGRYAGLTNTGPSLTAVGYNAGKLNSGAYTTAVGAVTAQANSGGQLTALGAYAARYNTGDNVTAVGFNAAYFNSSTYVTAVGTSAAYSNSGTNVTALGYSAGQNNTAGSVVAAGSYAGQFNSAANFTAVGYAAGQNNSGVGATVLGLAAGQNNAGNYLTAMGYGAGKNNTGLNNTAIGDRALTLNTTGTNNTGLGAWSMISNTTGSQNTALGQAALYSNATSSYNTAVGWQALFTDVGGTGNSGFGGNALLYNQNGSYNTTVGFNAARGTGAYDVTGTVALGYLAGINLATNGNYNTLLGYSTGQTLTTGASNILIGASADAPSAASSFYLNIGNAISGTMVSNSSMAFIGGIKANGIVTATYFEGDGSRLTNLPSGASDRIVSGTTSVTASLNNSITFTTSGTQRMVIGANGNIGIGTSTPGTTLDLANGNLAAGRFSVSGYLGSSYWLPTDISSTLSAYKNLILTNYSAGYHILISPTGNVGIATSNPTAKLEVSGTVSATALQLADSPAITCGPATYGTTKFINGRPYYCRP